MQIDTKISAEDNVQLVFSNRAGWQAHMLFSWAHQRGHLPDIVIAGEKWTFHLWPGTSQIDYYPVSPPLVPRLLSNIRPYWLQEKLMRPQFSRVRIRPAEKEGSGYLGEYREFIAAVAVGREPASPPEDGRRDLEIVLRCYDALRDDCRIGIDPVAFART